MGGRVAWFQAGIFVLLNNPGLFFFRIPLSAYHPQRAMTRWRENKDKRGVKATKYVFTTEQEKILYDYGWELEQNINTIAKGRTLKNNSHVTAWKKKNASAIFALPEFETLDLSEYSQVNWVTVSDLASHTRID